MFKLKRMDINELLSLAKEPMNKTLRDWDEAHAESLRDSTLAFTGLVNDELVFCFGLTPLWNKRGYLWVVLSERIKYHGTAVYRNVKKLLDEQQLFDRIEMDSPVDFELGHRRALFLGFKLECARAKKYSPLGEDKALYAWVRGE